MARVRFPSQGWECWGVGAKYIYSVKPSHDSKLLAMVLRIATGIMKKDLTPATGNSGDTSYKTVRK